MDAVNIALILLFAVPAVGLLYPFPRTSKSFRTTMLAVADGSSRKFETLSHEHERGVCVRCLAVVHSQSLQDPLC